MRRPRQPISDPRTSFYVGIGPMANIVVEGDDEITKLIRTGGGFDIFLGYRFHKMAAIEIGGMFTFHDVERVTGTRDFESGILTGITGDLKFFFLPSSRRLEPFLQVGGGGYMFQPRGLREPALGRRLPGGRRRGYPPEPHARHRGRVCCTEESSWTTRTTPTGTATPMSSRT